ncbi:MAG: D-inositol-3-phosphate glycosyltransferase [Anaerolineales bacterium]|nr:D-inositol-3-phosphate glycosyltransferase [Anaerolineales bacterium]
MKSVYQGVAKSILRAASWNWKPYSRLILYGDSVGWSLDWDMRELANISRRLGVRLAHPLWKHAAAPQSFFFASQFFLENDEWFRFLPGRIAFSYFHGLPNTGDDLMDRVYNGLQLHHERVARVQVTHTEMRDVVLSAGIDPSKVFLIPIGINLDYFPAQSAERKKATRGKLDIPQSAFVIGSFQKDGVGWGDGMEPKLIKGPDVFLETIRRLKGEIPELFVLLTGPARGYVKHGLDEMGVPYKHAYYKHYPEVAEMFAALDLYIVASRQEGGPKAVLESMASGVPLVTTRVGQAMDIVRHGVNGWMTDVENTEALAAFALQVYRSDSDSLNAILNAGRATAEANSYDSQTELWASFMNGFVERG